MIVATVTVTAIIPMTVALISRQYVLRLLVSYCILYSTMSDINAVIYSEHSIKFIFYIIYSFVNNYADF